MKYLLPILTLYTFTIIGTNLSSLEKAIQFHAEAFLHFSCIETEQLIIRKLEMNDVDDIFTLTSDPEVIKLTPIFTLMHTKQEVEDYLAAIITNYQKGYPDYWAIVCKENRNVIGIIGLDIASKHKADLGFAIARNYWGNGFATQATRAVINFGFSVLKLKRIEATCDPQNNASERVLQKCGLSYEGLLHSYYNVRGQMCDRKMYAIINKE